MENLVLEFSKSLFSLANMIFTLIFLKSFWDNNDINSLEIGFFIWGMIYFIATTCILLEENKRRKENDRFSIWNDDDGDNDN